MNKQSEDYDGEILRTRYLGNTARSGSILHQHERHCDVAVMCSNMQWSQSIPTFHVRIRASLEQQSSGSQVPVLGRHVQSRKAFLQCQQNQSCRL